jgi:hypothetical protein
MKYVSFSLILALVVVIWDQVLQKIGRRLVGRAYGLPAILFISGSLVAVVFAAIPVGLSGTPNWTYGIALSLTLGLLVYRVIGLATATGASPRPAVAEQALLRRRGLLAVAVTGGALGTLLIIGGVAQIQSGGRGGGGGVATVILGVSVIVGGGVGLFLLRKTGSAK